MLKKIVFMGTPEFSVPILKSLYQNGCLISAIYSQPPKKSMRGQKVNKSSIQKFSEKLNLNIRTPAFLKNNTEEFEYFKSINPDIVIVVAYGQLIPKNFLNISKFGFINIHASILPRWRGAAPIQRAIMNLDKVTGISVMKMVEELDAGPIMYNKEIKLDRTMNAEEVSNKLSKLSSEIILDCLEKIEFNKTKFIDQDHTKATYAKKINKLETQIMWDEKAINIVAKINALYPSPGAWFFYKSKRYKILKAIISDKEGKPGTVLDDSLTVGCKFNSIKILEIQKEGKNIQKTQDFLLGTNIEKNTVLS